MREMELSFGLLNLLVLDWTKDYWEKCVVD